MAATLLEIRQIRESALKSAVNSYVDREFAGDINQEEKAKIIARMAKTYSDFIETGTTS